MSVDASGEVALEAAPDLLGAAGADPAARRDSPGPVGVDLGPVTARRAGRHGDELITVGAPQEKITQLFHRFTMGAREAGKDPHTMPRMLQLHLSWAATDEEAMANALREWPNGAMRFPKADIRSPHDFAAMARLVREILYG